MTDLERLQAENEELRQEVEDRRQRELSELKEQLALARADVSHYRAEAERNANVGREIYAEAQAERARHVERIQTLERLPNAQRDIRASAQSG